MLIEGSNRSLFILCKAKKFLQGIPIYSYPEFGGKSNIVPTPNQVGLIRKSQAPGYEC